MLTIANDKVAFAVLQSPHPMLSNNVLHRVTFQLHPTKNRMLSIPVIAFAAKLLVTCQQTAQLTLPSQENPSPHSLQVHKASTPSLHPTGSISASIGPVTPTAPLVAGARMPTPAACAEIPPTVLAIVNLAPDPCIVVTPLIALRVEELLRKYDIFDDWQHIVYGICNGFNVGVTNPPSKTYTF